MMMTTTTTMMMMTTTLINLPDINVELVKHHLELVHQRNVDRSVDVLHQLRRLCDPCM